MGAAELTNPFNPDVYAGNVKWQIQQDTLAADLHLSLFIGASQSFKYESLLKPVPACFKKVDGEVDIDKLRKLIAGIPRLSCDEINVGSDHEILSLLKTVLLHSSYKLTSVPLSKFKSEVAGKIDLKIMPKWIFQVDYPSSRQETWDRLKSGRDVFLAFHGSRFENFHSILSLGLHQHLNKVKSIVFWLIIYPSTFNTV